jgi:hypothetical protein
MGWGLHLLAALRQARCLLHLTLLRWLHMLLLQQKAGVVHPAQVKSVAATTIVISRLTAQNSKACRGHGFHYCY